jgi:ABC-type transport system substrate-binding protein
MTRIAAQQSPFPAVSRATIARLLICAAVLATALSGVSASAAPPKGGAANLAMIGEPQTLDPMASTADLVGTIMQHVYELLYTYDANSNVVPCSPACPRFRRTGSWRDPLRAGVKFHNGKDMTSADVVARWRVDGDGAARQAVAKEIKWSRPRPNAIVIAPPPVRAAGAHLALSNCSRRSWPRSRSPHR